MVDVSPRAVVIGASAGAVDALSQVLMPLPAGFALPVMIVVHLPPDKKSVLAGLFQTKAVMAVLEAEHTQPIEPGTVYFAPSDYHLLVERNHSLSLSNEEPVHYSRPSIDVLFETAAEAYGAGLIGVILTGANDDGARGLRAVVDAGGIALVQEPARAFATAMPLAAIKACPEAHVLSLAGIVDYLQKAAA